MHTVVSIGACSNGNVPYFGCLDTISWAKNSNATSWLSSFMDYLLQLLLPWFTLWSFMMRSQRFSTFFSCWFYSRWDRSVFDETLSPTEFYWLQSIVVQFRHLQGLIKVYHIRYVDDLQWMLRFVQYMYKIHVKTESAERLRYFNNFAWVTEYLFIVMSTSYLLSVFTFFPYPVYVYLFQGEVVTIVPVYLPYLDHTQFADYCILSSFHISLIVFGTLGILACDFFMAVIIVSTLIFAKLISLELEQVNCDCEQKHGESIVKGRLRNILLMHQEMIK